MLAVEFLKTAAPEKFVHQRKYKNPGYAQIAAAFHKRSDQTLANSPGLAGGMNSYRAYLGQIGPVHMHGAAANYRFRAILQAGSCNYQIILDMLIKILGTPGEHDIGCCILIDECRHAMHVANPGLTDSGSEIRRKGDLGDMEWLVARPG